MQSVRESVLSLLCVDDRLHRSCFIYETIGHHMHEEFTYDFVIVFGQTPGPSNSFPRLKWPAKAAPGREETPSIYATESMERVVRAKVKFYPNDCFAQIPNECGRAYTQKVPLIGLSTVLFMPFMRQSFQAKS